MCTGHNRTVSVLRHEHCTARVAPSCSMVLVSHCGSRCVCFRHVLVICGHVMMFRSCGDVVMWSCACSGPSVAIDIEDFVLNRPEYKDASILVDAMAFTHTRAHSREHSHTRQPHFIVKLQLQSWLTAASCVLQVAGDNFGCGSSREHAPWSINGMGIRCDTAFALLCFHCLSSPRPRLSLSGASSRAALPTFSSTTASRTGCCRSHSPASRSFSCWPVRPALPPDPPATSCSSGLNRHGKPQSMPCRFRLCGLTHILCV